MHCNVAWFFCAFTLQFSIYAEIKLNCVKLNNIEISIHNFPSPIFQLAAIVLFLSDLWLMHSIIFTHCMALMCGLNVRACDRSATYLRQHFSSSLLPFHIAVDWKGILFGGWGNFLLNSRTCKLTHHNVRFLIINLSYWRRHIQLDSSSLCNFELFKLSYFSELFDHYHCHCPRLHKHMYVIHSSLLWSYHTLRIF